MVNSIKNTNKVALNWSGLQTQHSESLPFSWPCWRSPSLASLPTCLQPHAPCLSPIISVCSILWSPTSQELILSSLFSARCFPSAFEQALVSSFFFINQVSLDYLSHTLNPNHVPPVTTKLPEAIVYFVSPSLSPIHSLFLHLEAREKTSKDFLQMWPSHSPYPHPRTQ